MRELLILLTAAGAISAQTVANPERLSELWKNFDQPQGPSRLKCDISRIPPALNLGFRFQAGYNIELPMRQFGGQPQRWNVILRVTPKEDAGDPVWFVSRARIPAGAEMKANAQVSGSFLVGEGRYRVDLKLIDDRARSCVAGWDIRAKLSEEVRNVRPGLPRGAIDDISLARWRRQPPDTGLSGPAHNISVLMHAASTSPGRVRLRGYDRMILMSALSSLLERLPLRNVRLTLFNMDRQVELFHTDDLTGARFREAVEALDNLETGTVDFSTLKNRGGHIDLMANILNREMDAVDPPDAIIFIGPVARLTDRISTEKLPEREFRAPFYYVQLRPWRRMIAGLPADTISRIVRKAGGRIKEVYSPQDFAEAIQEVKRLLDRERS